MSRPKCLTGGTNPGTMFCWHCSKQLQRAKGKGLYYFKLVVDQDGNDHRVHADCLLRAIGDGIKEKKG